MPDPEFKFNREKLTLDITGLTGGWSIADTVKLDLFNSAQVQFPSSWSQLKMAASLKIVDAQWKIHGPVLLEQTLNAGINYTRKDGVGGSVGSDTALVLHILHRPTMELNLKLSWELEGKATRHGFEGEGKAGIFIMGRF